MKGFVKVKVKLAFLFVGLVDEPSVKGILLSYYLKHDQWYCAGLAIKHVIYF